MEIWFSQLDTENVKTSVRVDKQLFSKQSEYQRIDVFESREFGRMIVLDGEIIFSEADEFIYNEMVVHVPMADHPSVKNVLIIGGGDGGVAKVLTQYPEIEAIDVVEPDEMFIEVSREFFPETAKGFDDDRVKITNMDGLRFLRRCRDKYDLIINDSTDPLAIRRDCLPGSSMAIAIGPCMMTALWSISMAARSMMRMRRRSAPCTARPIRAFR